MEVAGEARHDHPAIAMVTEQVAHRLADGALRGREPRTLRVRGVRQQQAHAAFAPPDLAEQREADVATVDGREVDLEVTRVHDRARGREEGRREAVRHRVRDRDELAVERTDAPALAVVQDDELGAVEHAGLLDAPAREGERQRRPVDGHRHVLEEVRQPAGMVLVRVREERRLDPVGVVDQVREVGQHDVDAGHVGVGEHEPAIDHEDAVVVLEAEAVAADLAHTAEQRDANIAGAHDVCDRIRWLSATRTSVTPDRMLGGRARSTAFCRGVAEPAGRTTAAARREPVVEVRVARGAHDVEARRAGDPAQFGVRALAHVPGATALGIERVVGMAAGEELHPPVERGRVRRLHDERTPFCEVLAQPGEEVLRGRVEVLEHLAAEDRVVAVEAVRAAFPGRRLRSNS